MSCSVIRFRTIAAVSPLSRRNASTCMWTFPCCRRSPCPSPPARFAIPGSKSTTPASSGYWKFPAAQQQATHRRLDMAPRFPAGRCHDIPAFPQDLRTEPAPLRSPQAEGSRTSPTRWPTLCLPPHCQRRQRCAPVPVLPQAPLWSAGQQPLPSQTRPGEPTRQQTRSRLSQSRQGHPEHR